MNKKISRITFAAFLLTLLTACSSTGEKTASAAAVYYAAAIISLLLFIGYCCFVKKKETWFLILLLSVFITNIGYVALAIARNLDEALLANRIAYFGSVLLPLAMLMIIQKVSKVVCPRFIQIALIVLSMVMFLIAATPGYSDIYYKDVCLETVNGMTVLHKVYGPWHPLYLFYLLGYFAATSATVIYAVIKKKPDSPAHSAFLVAVLFVNIAVWFAEQFIPFDFEILSVSYIISELLLLGMNMLANENSASKQPAESVPFVEAEVPENKVPAVPAHEAPASDEESAKEFLAAIETLTKTEHAIFEMYIAGKTTKEIMSELNIKENTLKFHNKNIYGKLGISSRKQLIEMYNRTSGNLQ